jgi:hypothetical protein
MTFVRGVLMGNTIARENKCFDYRVAFLASWWQVEALQQLLDCFCVVCFV